MLAPLLVLAAITAPAEELAAPPKTRALKRAIAESQRDLMATVDLYEDHSTWENAWRVETRRYVVRTTHSRHLAVDIGEGLEMAFGWFQDLLGTTWEPTEKIPVHIYPTLADFNQIGQDINADEHSSFYGAFYAVQHAERPIAVMYNGHRTFLKMQATHGALHQFVATAFNNEPPLWVSEGLATYFAHFWDYPRLCSEHRRLADGDFIPLRSLTNATLGNFADRSNDKMIELGALFNYFLHRRPDTMIVIDEDGEVVQAPFRDLVRGAVRGRNLVLDPTYLSLLARLPQIEADFRAYTFPQ